MEIQKSIRTEISQNYKSRVPKCVLIIDDDALARGIVRMLFESEGYQCEEAENGAFAFRSMEAGKVDLVITDNQMPLLSGLEFLDRLHERFNSKAPPVIMVTGNVSNSVKERALRAGASAVLEKPYDLEQLRCIAFLALNTQQHLNSQSAPNNIH